MTVYKEVKNILYNMKWLTFILLFTMSAFALGESLLLTVTVPTGTDAVRLTGPEWKWNPNSGPEATDNGDGTWSVTLDPAPTDNMEYLWVVDDVQENLIDIAATNAKCSLNTDFWSYANRVVPKGSGNAANTYNSCYPTAPVPTDAANSVLSVFSTKYGNLVNTNFNPYWGQSTEVHSTGDNLVYTNLNYQGTSFDSPLNLSPYIYLNIDYYVVQSTSLNFFLISPGDGKETSVALNVSTPNQWVNVKIPLNESYSAVVDLAKVIQFKVDGNGQVAFNNLYFGGSVSDIKGCTDSNAYNYNSEATKSDDSCIFYVSVTFKVNMTGQDTSDGVSVVGGNHFGKEGVVMTGPNGDGIWTVEAQLPPNTTVNFKYRATTESTWDSQETVPANCGFGEWRDRQVNVGVANKTLNVTYFSSCDDKPPVLNPITYWPLSENFLSVEAFCEDDDCNVAVGMTRNGDFGVYYLKTYNDISTNSPSQGYVTINYSERNVEAYDRLKISMKKGLWHNSNIPVHVKLEQKGCVNSAEVSLIDGCQMIPIDRLKGTTNLTDEIGRNGNCNIDLSTGVNVTFIMGEYNKTDSLNYDFEISSVEFTTTKDICTYGCTDPAADNYNPAVDIDNGNCTYTYITITTTVCGTASNVRMTGPWWDWNLNGGPEAEGPEATDNGDGKWTFKMIAPKLDMEYLLVVDGKLEHFTVDDDCVTNSTTRENSTSREWKVGSGNVTNTYDTCGNCQDFTYGCTDTDADNYNDTADIDNGNCTYTYITITTTVCGTASNVRMTGPWWGWKPNGGPEATDNGDGKWTFNMTAPKEDMEYLLVVDGILEQFTAVDYCAPGSLSVTNSTSREWKVGSGNVTNTYDTCGNCQDFRIKQEDFRIKQEDFRIKQGIKELFFNPPLDDKWHLQKECITDDGNCWANDEKQHYTDRSDNAYVSGGHLHIVAKKEQYVYQNVTKSYTSARLNSKYDFKYGTVKVRAKLPKQKGLWPAIWTLGSNIDEVGVHDFKRSPEVAWPYCGEIDIMEQYGTQNFVGSAMHGPSYNVITAAAGGKAIPWNTEVVVDEFHVYSMEWTAEKIIFKVDEVTYKTVTAPSVTTNWPFNHKHFLLLNVAVEPVRTGGIENFESGEMVVDYVRIYGENGVLNWSDEFGLGWSDEFISYLESVPKSILKEAYNSRSGC
jgi:hypothetical protein